MESINEKDGEVWDTGETQHVWDRGEPDPRQEGVWDRGEDVASETYLQPESDEVRELRRIIFASRAELMAHGQSTIRQGLEYFGIRNSNISASGLDVTAEPEEGTNPALLDIDFNDERPIHIIFTEDDVLIDSKTAGQEVPLPTSYSALSPEQMDLISNRLGDVSEAVYGI